MMRHRPHAAIGLAAILVAALPLALGSARASTDMPASSEIAAWTPLPNVGPEEQAEAEPAIPREIVPFSERFAVGTIIVNTEERRLYYVLGEGKAMRYGIGVGRPGFAWTGEHKVSLMREWPDWRPPAAMLKRRPDLPRHMAGGEENPLGARALYLGNSIYRIHGSNEPDSIGYAVSSGCIRMMNEDVIDLYARVRVGTRVVVR